MYQYAKNQRVYVFLAHIAMKTEDALHLAIIPDGNRRWAAQNALAAVRGHEKALSICKDLTEWCRQDPRIAVLTFWAFSTENWSRSRGEIEQLMILIEKFLQRERPTFIKNKIKVVHSGRLDRIPASLAALLRDVVAETDMETDFTLHLALDYGGRDEIARAVQKVKDPAAVSVDTFRQYLDHPELPDIDLIIRTSGEQRTSNFFLWQGAFAELFFAPKFFPEFTPADLATAIDNFSQRTRRFGQ